MDELSRFTDAQKYDYDTALAEIRRGRKESHWMWYIFPQISGLGRSSVAQFYSIKNLEEAKAYMRHPVLGARLIEISQALLDLDGNDAGAVFGWPDDMKLKSSMTLFEKAAPEQTVFSAVLDKFFHGKRDQLTLKILENE